MRSIAGTRKATVIALPNEESWIAGARLARAPVEGGLIASHISGSGPPVVLLAPLFFDGRVWTPQIERLEGTHTAIAVDQRGHGVSSRPAEPYDPAADVEAALADLGVHRSAVVGMREGAEYALRIAVRGRVDVVGLVLILPNVAWLVRELDPGRFYAGAREAIETLNADPELADMRDAIAALDEEAIAASIADDAQAEIPQSDSRRAVVEAMVRSNVHAVFETELVKPGPSDLAERLRTLAVPTLVLAASEEGADELLALMSGRLADVHVEVIHSNAPAVTLAHPDVCNDAIAAFLARIPSTEP